jgi:hypothetical protein
MTQTAAEVASPPVRRKWWGWKILIPFIVAITISLWLSWDGIVGKYRFVRRLGGVNVSTSNATGRSWVPMSYYGIDEYAFAGDPDRVRRAMKQEMLGKGWTLVYEDETEMYFKEPHHLDDSPSAGYQRLDPPSGKFTCCVGVVSTGNWIQEIARDLFGDGNLPLPDVHLPYRNFPGDWVPSGLGDRVGVDFTYKNLTDFPVVFELTDFYYMGRESIEAGPVVETVQPWTRKKFRLTYPVKVTRAIESDYSYKWSESAPGRPRNPVTGGDLLIDPRATLAGDIRLGHAVVLRSRRPVAMELRNIRVIVNYKVIIHDPGIHPLKRGEKLRMSFPKGMFKRRGAIYVLVRGDARLSPNKRWRSFEITPDGR